MKPSSTGLGRFATSLFVVSLASACAAGKAPRHVPVEPCVDGRIVAFPGSRGVVFPSSRGWYDESLPDDPNLRGYWDPTDADIRAAEEALRRCVAEQAPRLLEDLGSYGRQYFGVVIGRSRRVFINAFRHPEAFPEWRCRPVAVDDGGDWYFRAEYDLESGKCLGFLVHGDA